MRAGVLVAAFVIGCGRDAGTKTTVAPVASSSIDLALAEVDRVHGGHGPWAVAG